MCALRQGSSLPLWDKLATLINPKGVCSLSLHSRDFPDKVLMVHLRFIVDFSQPASNLVLSLACRMSLVGSVEQLHHMVAAALKKF